MFARRKMIPAFLLFVVLCLGAVENAQADPVTIRLTNPVQSGMPGAVLTFTADVTNPGPLPFQIVGSIVTDVHPDFGLFIGDLHGGTTLIVPPGATVNEQVFILNIKPDATPGTYTFNTYIFGYDINGYIIKFEDSNKVPGVITVLSPDAVPEPATILLLGTGVAGLALKARKRRKDS